MESFDEYIRRTMSEQTHEFDEKYWLEAQRLLDDADRKRRRRKAILWWLGGGAGCVLLAVLTGWLTGILPFGEAFSFGKKTTDSTAENAVLIEKRNQLIEKRIEKSVSGDSMTAKKGADFSIENGGPATEKATRSASKNGAGQAPKLAQASTNQKTIQQQNSTPRAGREAAEKESDGQPSAEQTPIFSRNKNAETANPVPKNDAPPAAKHSDFLDKTDSEIRNPQPEIGAGGVEQTIEIQRVGPVANSRSPIPQLPGLPIPFLKEPVRVILMPFFEWKMNLVLAGSVDSTATPKKGWSFGFDGGFLLAKPDSFNRMQLYRTGIFAEKELKRDFFISFSLDYELLSGLNASWPQSFSTSKYRFGLEPQTHSVVLKQVSYLTPGVRFGWHFLPKNRLLVGLQMRSFLAARVRVNSTARDPFGELIDANPPTQTGRWAKPPKTLNRFLPVASARYELEPLGWLKIGAEASFQLNRLTDLGEELPTRFDRRLFFGGYVRVNLK